MSKKLFFFGILLAAVLGGLVSIGFMQLLDNDPPAVPAYQNEQNVQLSKFMDDSTFTRSGVHPSLI